MGVTSLPKDLSPEELALQKHYNQLKKIKKQLQDLKATKKQEQALATSSQGTKRGHSENAEEATEQAKKLLKAGAIKVAAETKEKTFKRTAVKKAKESDRPTSMFQPFVSASESPEGYRPRGKAEFKNLYDCFVSSKKAAASPGESSGAAPAGASSKALYVAGSGLTEAMLRQAFGSYGAITSVVMEQGKSSGFVTMADSQSADEAVERLNGTMVMDVMLTVEVARRQPPQVSRSASQSSASAAPLEKGASAWTELAADKRSKNGADSKIDRNTDKRALVTYDESDIFS